MNIEKENLPVHVAVVPDGNRRWAKKRSMTPWQGHFEGAKRAQENLQTALEMGLHAFTLWGGSFENLTKRSKMEIKMLFKIYDQYFKKLLKSKEIHQHQVRVSIIGRWKELLPQKGIDTIERLVEATKDYNKKFLNFCIAYNGTDEMLAAIKGIVKESRGKKNSKVDEHLLKKYLWSGHLPPIDLLIRTGSSDDPHNSVGFMMWQTANSQYYFTNTPYPDFNKQEFLKAIKEYQRRERRLGK